MPWFEVIVVEKRVVKYLVEAEHADDAQRQVEESKCADNEFVSQTEDGEWYVDEIRECDKRKDGA